MPSFLTKVFGRKKDGGDDYIQSRTSLLDGKFEEISPTVSPSAAEFPELKSNGSHRGRGAERTDSRLRSFFRSRSRPASPIRPQRKFDELPHLPLSLFSDVTQEDSQFLLTDKAIGERRLTPIEVVGLVKACSQAIRNLGPETLGLMTPHWYSASPEIQRRLISLFIHSLAGKRPLSNAPSFDNEINSTRSTHDVAAVLRWGLRHLQLQGDSFGLKADWYQSFFLEERNAEFPSRAFSNTLAPLIPPEHYELLKEVLELFSCLAPHAESNSTSGSKLSKVFGLWLLNAHRVESKDDWRSFYDRWEIAGRQLEHVFLARIRDEATVYPLPIRLLDLVRRYPFHQDGASPTTDLQLLPRPKFTTRVHDALLVRVETELPNEKLRPKSKTHPLRLIAEALSATAGDGEFAVLWAKIVNASNAGSGSTLTKIFSDETIRILSLLPEEEGSHDSKSPTFSLLPTSPLSTKSNRLSFSLSDFTEIKRTASTQSKSTASPLSPVSAGDWSVFSASGFGSSPTLSALSSPFLSPDVDRAALPVSRKSSKNGKESSASGSAPRKSVEFSPAPIVKDVPAVVQLSSKIGPFQLVQLDEAFLDFWSDAMLDSLTVNWPAFVLCKVKGSLIPELQYGGNGDGEGREGGKKRKTLKWIVLEQAYTVKPPPAPEPEANAEHLTRDRPSSPQSLEKKRFSFWSSSRSNSVASLSSTKAKRKDRGQQRAGEMGEVLEEDRESPNRSAATTAGRSRKRGRDDVVRVRIPSPKGRRSGEGVASTSINSNLVGRKSEEGSRAAEVTGIVAAAAAVAAVAVVAKEDAIPEVVEEKDAAVTPEAAKEAKVAPLIEQEVVLQDTLVEANAVPEEAVALVEREVVDEMLPVLDKSIAEETVAVVDKKNVEGVTSIALKEIPELTLVVETQPEIVEEALAEEAPADSQEGVIANTEETEEKVEEAAPAPESEAVQIVAAEERKEDEPAPHVEEPEILSTTSSESISEGPVAFIEMPVVPDLKEVQPVTEEAIVAKSVPQLRSEILEGTTTEIETTQTIPELTNEPSSAIEGGEDKPQSVVPLTTENGGKSAPREEGANLEATAPIEVEKVLAHAILESASPETIVVQEEASVVVSELDPVSEDAATEPEAETVKVLAEESISLDEPEKEKSAGTSIARALEALVVATEETFGPSRSVSESTTVEVDPETVVSVGPEQHPAVTHLLDQAAQDLPIAPEEDKAEATEDVIVKSHFVAQEAPDNLADPVVAVLEREAEKPQGNGNVGSTQEIEEVTAEVDGEDDAAFLAIETEPIEGVDAGTAARPSAPAEDAENPVILERTVGLVLVEGVEEGAEEGPPIAGEEVKGPIAASTGEVLEDRFAQNVEETQDSMETHVNEFPNTPSAKKAEAKEDLVETASEVQDRREEPLVKTETEPPRVVELETAEKSEPEVENDLVSTQAIPEPESTEVEAIAVAEAGGREERPETDLTVVENASVDELETLSVNEKHVLDEEKEGALVNLTVAVAKELTRVVEEPIAPAEPSAAEVPEPTPAISRDSAPQALPIGGDPVHWFVKTEVIGQLESLSEAVSPGPVAATESSAIEISNEIVAEVVEVHIEQKITEESPMGSPPRVGEPTGLEIAEKPVDLKEPEALVAVIEDSDLAGIASEQTFASEDTSRRVEDAKVVPSSSEKAKERDPLPKNGEDPSSAGEDIPREDVAEEAEAAEASKEDEYALNEKVPQTLDQEIRKPGQLQPEDFAAVEAKTEEGLALGSTATVDEKAENEGVGNAEQKATRHDGGGNESVVCDGLESLRFEANSTAQEIEPVVGLEQESSKGTVIEEERTSVSTVGEDVPLEAKDDCKAEDGATEQKTELTAPLKSVDVQGAVLDLEDIEKEDLVTPTSVEELSRVEEKASRQHNDLVERSVSTELPDPEDDGVDALEERGDSVESEQDSTAAQSEVIVYLETPVNEEDTTTGVPLSEESIVEVVSEDFSEAHQAPLKSSQAGEAQPTVVVASGTESVGIIGETGQDNGVSVAPEGPGVAVPNEEPSISANVLIPETSQAPPQEPNPSLREQTSAFDETKTMATSGTAQSESPSQHHISQPSNDDPVLESSSGTSLDEASIGRVIVDDGEEPPAESTRAKELNTLSSIPHIELLKTSEEDSSNNAVQLPEVPFVDVKITPPNDYTEFVVISIPKDEEAPRPSPEKPPTLEHLTLVESFVEAQDLPSAIEEVFKTGLTPSPQALLDAVQATLSATLFAPEAPTVQASAPVESEEKKDEVVLTAVEIGTAALNGEGHQRGAGEESVTEKPQEAIAVEETSLPVESNEPAVVVNDDKTDHKNDHTTRPNEEPSLPIETREPAVVAQDNKSVEAQAPVESRVEETDHVPAA